MSKKSDVIARSISHNEIVTIDYDSDAVRDLSCEAADSVEANGLIEYWSTLIEEMPDYLRGSHRAAGNWGVYPHNGATRRSVSREEAEQIVADDEDGYDRIIGDWRVHVRSR